MNNSAPEPDSDLQTPDGVRSFRLYPSTWEEARAAALLLVSLLILGVADFLRCESAGPMWLDELHTQWCIDGVFADVFDRATIGNQSPLYFWANYLLSEFLTPRGMAVCCSIAALASIGWIVFLWSRCWTAVIVTLLLAAIDDSMIYFGAEARPYAAVQLVAVWQVHFFCRHLLAATSKRWADGRLILTSALLVNLHLTAAIVLISELLFVLFLPLLQGCFARPKFVVPWRRSFFVALVVGLLCLPAAWLAMKVGANRSDWGSVDDVQRLALFFVASVLVYVALPALWLLPLQSANRSNASATEASEASRLAARPMTIVLGVVAILSFATVLGLAASELAPLARLRYSIAGFTLLFPLAGLMVAQVRNFKWRFVSAILVVGLAVTTNPMFVPVVEQNRLVQQRNEPWREAVGLLKDDTRPLLFFPNLIEDQRFSNASDPAFTKQIQQYYRFPIQALFSFRFTEERDAYGLPIPREGASFELRPEQLAEVKLRRGCTMIVRARNEDAVRLIDEVEFWLQNELGPVERRWRKRGVLTVVEFSLAKVAK